LWVYYSTNLQNEKNIPQLEAIFRRAGAADYTQVCPTDSKFGRLGTVPAIYFKNAERVKELATALHLEIVSGIVCSSPADQAAEKAGLSLPWRSLWKARGLP
jgi:hypothetical protein